MSQIFQYTDYRLFLKDALQDLKGRNPKASQRWVQQRLGIKSSGWLADLLAGRRKLEHSRLEIFAQLLSLSPREELYFQALVDYAHAPNASGRAAAFEKLASFQEVSCDLIDPDRFEYFGKWYYGAVREWLLIEPYRGNPAHLASSLNPPITTAQAKEAIAVLERLGMIRRHAGGEMRPATEHVKKLAHFGPEHYYRYIRSQMTLGLDAVERISKDERDVSALTLALSSAGFRTFCQELKDLRKRMIQLSEEENKKGQACTLPGSRRVYQAILQVFPVSRAHAPKEPQP